MRTNVKRNYSASTHEGGRADPHLTHEQILRRSVMSCMLFEKEFYEDGEDIATRILEHATHVPAEKLCSMAMEARHAMKLRHAPLLLLIAAIRQGGSPHIAPTIAAVCRRPDDMTELLALYWRNGKKPLANQLRKGLAAAFDKFDEYQLAKYASRPAEIKLRDVMFLAHPKPETREREALYKRLAEGTLQPADTWERGLSTGGDKAETFTDLLQRGKLGYMALLRNLRNMVDAGVDRQLVRNAIHARKGAEGVLPFQYVAAAIHAPSFEPDLDAAFSEAISSLRLKGETIVLVDVSASMGQNISRHSVMTRMHAAGALAAMVPGPKRVFTFSDRVVEVPPRNNLSMIDTVRSSQPNGCTYLGRAVKQLNSLNAKRLIVFTDEQSHDAVPAPRFDKAYMINVASYRNGIDYGQWTHIDGFSEAVLNFIIELE